MTRSLSVTPNDNRAEFNYTQWSMILSWNNNNKRLRSRYYTVEATDGHKASRGLSATVNKDEYTCHLLHTDRMQLYTVSKKYTPWLLTMSCCNLSAILLLNPLNTVRLSTQSSAIIRIVVIVRLSRRIRILVVSASHCRLSKNSLKSTTVPFPLSFTVLVYM